MDCLGHGRRNQDICRRGCGTDDKSRNGCPTYQAVIVGDSETDIIAGQNASVKTVLVSYGYFHIPHKQLGADIIIDRFADLPMALDQLANT